MEHGEDAFYKEFWQLDVDCKKVVEKLHYNYEGCSFDS